MVSWAPLLLELFFVSVEDHVVGWLKWFKFKAVCGEEESIFGLLCKTNHYLIFDYVAFAEEDLLLKGFGTTRSTILLNGPGNPRIPLEKTKIPTSHIARGI